MLFFVFLCVIFILAGLFSLHLIVFKRDKDNYYQVVASLYVMLIVHLLFLLTRNDILSENSWNIIFVVFSMTIIAIMITYLLFYFSTTNKIRKSRSNLVLIMLISEILLLLIFSSKMNYNELIYTIAALILFFVFICMKLILVKKNKTKEKMMTDYEASKTDIPLEIYLKYSLEDNNALSEIVFNLYHMAKSHQVNPRKLNKYLLDETDLPISSVHRVEDRFLELYSLSKTENIGILEFANLLFPEFYSSSNRTVSSEGYESRLFEEYYIMLKKNINIRNAEYDKINKKLDKLLTVDFSKQIEKTKDEPKLKVESSEYAQSVVREINHCVKTPMLAVKYAIKNLLINEDELTDKQKEKLETINCNLSTIESIINGYRRLVVFSGDNFPDKIVPHILTAINALNQQHNKNIKINIKNFVEPNITHGSNIITIMLLPLVNNAYEASPENETVIVECLEKGEEYIIRIENKCESKIVADNLSRDGFTTKEKGGEGLRSVRRISSSLNFDFSINSYESGRKVVATLKIPTNKENDINGRKEIACVVD